MYPKTFGNMTHPTVAAQHTSENMIEKEFPKGFDCVAMVAGPYKSLETNVIPMKL